MGEFNSSVTRVWPIFDYLFNRDSTGIEWFPQLLRMGSEFASANHGIDNEPGPLLPHLAQFDRNLPGLSKKVLGSTRAAQIARIRNAFESDIPPSDEFLRWLLENPERLEWPLKNRRKKVKRTYGDLTQQLRMRLVSGDRDCRNEALIELDAVGVSGSQMKWWAFEGFTSVDCRLETDKLLVLIEGKRTESVSSSTEWFSRRNHVIRNLEVARSLSGGKKNYAVLVCAENDVTFEEESWADSLPHMTEFEHQDLRSHFLGCVKWSAIAKELCGNLRLPDNLDDAVKLCLSYR
jgi:hypothetical protein